MLSDKLKQNIVLKLVSQYHNYTSVLAELNNTKFELLKTDGEELLSLKNKINVLNRLLDRIGDEMTFPTPSIWIMYKYNAYKDTDKQIKTVKDFIDHCSPEGYICTKRFSFLSTYMDIKHIFNNKNEDLEVIFNSNELAKLENDSEFMNLWLDNEFKIVENRIAKWE